MKGGRERGEVMSVRGYSRNKGLEVGISLFYFRSFVLMWFI